MKVHFLMYILHINERTLKITEHVERIFPANQVAYGGDTVFFTCAVNTKVKWTYEGGPLPSNAKGVHDKTKGRNHLRISNVNAENEGVYYCSGEEDDNLHFDDKVELQILGKIL